MSAGFLADAVLVTHAVFVAWVVFGVVAVWRRPRLAVLHLPALAWGIWIEASGRVCPLTPLEVSLRRLASAGNGRGSERLRSIASGELRPAPNGRDLRTSAGKTL